MAEEKVVNNLNSVIIEGEVVNVRRYADRTEFGVVSNHYTCEHGKDIIHYQYKIPVKVYAGLRKDFLMSNGMTVRVVGMVREQNGKVYIHAEHIEVKPTK